MCEYKTFWVTIRNCEDTAYSLRENMHWNANTHFCRDRAFGRMPGGFPLSKKWRKMEQLSACPTQLQSTLKAKNGRWSLKT